MDMEIFWTAWAAREAKTQYLVCVRNGETKAPDVASVTPREDGTFLVSFMNGKNLVLWPSGIAHRPQ